MVTPHEWLVFFSEGRGGWWDVFLRKGFRHVCAVTLVWDLRAWVIYDPRRERTELVLIPEGPEAHEELSKLLASATAVLRMKPQAERGMGVPLFGCVAAVKGLLGIRSRALGPYGLYRHLLDRGAEIVEVPREVQQPPEGRPGDQGQA